MFKNKKMVICPLCNCSYSEGKKCPECGYKEPFRFNKKAGIIYLILFILFVYLAFYTQSIFNNSKEENFIELKLSPMSELSGLTRDEIFNIRKEAVKSSRVFKIENYKPDENIYQIEDNLPWISAEEIVRNGIKNNPNIGKGNSRSSIFINNPEFLIGFIIPEFYDNNYKKDFSEADYFLPYKLLWNDKSKTMRVYFKISSFFENNKAFSKKYNSINMLLDETNARDMGYNWIYPINKHNASYKNIKWVKPYQMKGYYNKGFACGLDGGCNNYSPYQPQMEFSISKIYFSDSYKDENDNGGYTKFKLWKDKPASYLQKADLTYEMYFY